MQSPDDPLENERARRANRRELVAILAIVVVTCALILVGLVQRLLTS